MSLGQIFREVSRTYRLPPAIALHAAALLLTLPVLTLTASAQFTGPALPVSTYINPTLTPTTDPAILYPANRDLKLDTGDIITIHLFGSPDYTPVARVAWRGRSSFR